MVGFVRKRKSCKGGDDGRSVVMFLGWDDGCASGVCRRLGGCEVMKH